VFLHQRWRGWVNRARSLQQQLREARAVATRFEQDPSAFGDADLRRAVPDWIAEHMELRPGWLRAIQGEPILWLRARPGTAPAIVEELRDAEASAGLLSDAVIYRGKSDLFRTPAFQAGRFEIQDISSQAVSLIASPQAAQSWWDACAGEGGKTLHLADLLRNRGVVWATDRAVWRLKRLRLRASRAGLFNIRWAQWEIGTKAHPSGAGAALRGGSTQKGKLAAGRGGMRDVLPPFVRSGTRFDGVLVDAPCSGVGTWQRNPDARWSLTQRDVKELAARQIDLLSAAAAAVKPGGRLVYAVCSLTREETLEVCAAFESVARDFVPLPMPSGFSRGNGDTPGQLWLWPQDLGGNGMFVAAWQRARDKSRGTG
jgi:16S rRNA (cytosine967-C5)-methyltransferase